MIALLLGVVLWLGILFTLLQAWYVAAIMLVGLFAWKFATYALVPVGFLVDVYFGAFYAVPAFTLLMLCLVVAVESVRGQLLSTVDTMGV